MKYTVTMEVSINTSNEMTEAEVKFALATAIDDGVMQVHRVSVDCVE